MLDMSNDTISGGAIIVMLHEASGKKKIRMASYLTSWNQADHPKPALARLTPF